MLQDAGRGADTRVVARGAQADCCTCVVVAVGGRVAAALAISDPLKPEARGVVAALARRGLAVHLVTGDNWRAPPQSVPSLYGEQLWHPIWRGV